MYTFVAYLFALLSFTFGAAIEVHPKHPGASGFNDVLELVSRNHISKPGHQELVDKALAGMLSSLDSHSSYMVGDEASEFLRSSSGKLNGIGVTTHPLEDSSAIVVMSVMPGSPAEKAGIRHSDEIVSINGKAVKELGFIRSIQNMRGPAGTKVALTVRKGDQAKLVEYSLTRECIAFSGIFCSCLEDGLAYIKVSEFGPNTAASARKAVNDLLLEKKPIHGIILDLRDNPGGALDQAVALTEYFIDSGVVVGIKGKDGTVEEMVASRSAPKAPKVPMVVLINGGSASAAEIVAGAMQAHNRAVIVGSKSYGKGSIQNIFRIKSDRLVLVKLTTALFCTPNGDFVDKKGITPDIVVEGGAPLAFCSKVSGKAKAYHPNSIADKQYQRAREVLALINKFSLQQMR